MEYQRATKSAQKEQSKTPSSSLHQASLNRVRAHPLLELQRTIGNQAVLNMLRSQKMQIDTTTQALIEPRFGHDFSQIPIHSSQTTVPQTKLTVNQPGDVNEQEADQVAEQVMRTTHLEASVPDDEDEAKNSLMHKQSKGLGADAATRSPDVPPVVHTLLSSGGGQPLDTTTRAFMESRFGHDFSKVRVYADERAAESAREMNALAYTVGQDVVLGSGQYSPQTSRGRWLLAHELAHTIQQGTSKHFLGAEDAISEHNADLAASSVVLNQEAKVASVATSPAIQFKKEFGFGGSFDRALETLDKEWPINEQAVKLLKQSPAFINIVGILNQHYVARDDAQRKERDENGNLPNGKRVLIISKDGGARFMPYSAPGNFQPGDVIYVESASDLITFIHDISHEATHAALMFEKVSQPTDLQGTIDLFIKNEIKTRKSTEKIAGEIPDANVSKEASERAARESTVPAEVQRDFSPGIGLTYLEAAVFDKHLSDALIAEQLTLKEALDIQEKVDDAVKKKAKEVPWIPRLRPVQLVEVSIPLPSEYAYIWFERQTAKREWEEFEEQHKNASPDAKKDAREKLLQDHLQRLNKRKFDKPVSYLPLPRNP